ncbi:glutamine synthetase [Dyella sp. EPa41]|nr:glutamine synthetase [Dyella sp. EPa41]
MPTDDFIDAYIALKMQDVTRCRASTHALEFQGYRAI